MHTMDKLAQALPEDGRAQQLAIVRNAHEETLREHGHDPARPTWGGGSEGADWEAHRDGRYQSSR